VQEPVAGYLHALWISREFAGLSLGAALIDDAARLTAEAGREWLRLDCWEGNASLRAFYEKQGFIYQGGGHEGWNACYQRLAIPGPA
jgi:ribosomal protein S18 acetylase RimI-like enzyme